MQQFNLQELAIFVSNKKDGSFRQAQGIKEFLQKQSSLGEEDFNLLHLQLENKNKVIVLEEEKLLSEKSDQVFIGDAILSNLSNIRKGERSTNKTLISMVVGDCFPLIFFDQKSKNVAMVHAGWEPLYLNILDRVWQQMEKLWGVQVGNLWAFLGPGIRAQSYCVTSKPRQSQHLEWQEFIKKVRQSHKNEDKEQKNEQKRELWQIDLPGFIKNFLTSRGLSQEQLIDSALDTYALPEQFFSHRRSQEQQVEGKVQLAQTSNGRFFVACQLP